MADILQSQMTFSDSFACMTIVVFQPNFTEICYQVFKINDKPALV